MQKTDFIILWHSTVHKKNITVLTPENKKKNSRYIYSNCSSTSEVHAALLLVEIYHNHKRVPLQELYERAMAKAKYRSA